MAVDATPNSLILIVEDNAVNLLLTRSVLERADFQVVAATSAEEAKKQLQEITPDLILMDVDLPGQDGLSLTRELRTMAQTATVPIVALTAHAMHGDRERALAAGCDGYVSKPFKARHLLDEIAATLHAGHR